MPPPHYVLMEPPSASLMAGTALFQKKQDVMLQLVLSKAQSPRVHVGNRHYSFCQCDQEWGFC